MRKEDIRSHVKARKAMLTDAERRLAADSVFAVLENSVAFMMADNILLYHSLPDELSTHAFIEKWHDRKHFFLPRVNGVNLDILPYNRSTLSLGAFHIEEPEGDDVTDISEIELIVVPGIAYDRHGNRVGRGKGYYDRLLASTRATKIGVGYDFQLVDEIDAEPHDVVMDLILTEHEIIRIPHRRRR